MSHSCACTWRVITIFLDVVDSCLKVSAYGGSSLKYISWAISARVLTLNVPVRLMILGRILTSVFRVPWV